MFYSGIKAIAFNGHIHTQLERNKSYETLQQHYFRTNLVRTVMHMGY